MPNRRCVEVTKSRGIPIGVGSGVGLQKRFPDGPIGTRAVVKLSGNETMAMAVVIR